MFVGVSGFRALYLKCVVFEKEVSFWMLYIGV